MKKMFTLTLLSTALLVGCQEKKADLSKEENKVFYSVGNMTSARFKTLNLNEEEKAAFLQGVKDALAGKKADFDTKAFLPKFSQIAQARTMEAAKKFKADGVKFLEKFVAEGAKKTKSGLAYKIEKAGEAKKPAATDTVTVHYKGTLIDGTEFDSSYMRNEPTSFPLNRVIPGWTEGLQLIGKGGKVKLVIPSELAYGDHGAPPKIPGGSTLVFEVELLDIKDAPAAGKNPHAGHNHK